MKNKNVEQQIIEQKIFSDTSSYDDIIQLPHHQSRAHLPMNREDRAGQFSPFAALTGFNNLIQKRAQIYKNKKYLSAEKENIIHQRLKYLLENKVNAIFYFFDDRDGVYKHFNDQIKEISWQRGRIYFIKYYSIPVANIEKIN